MPNENKVIKELAASEFLDLRPVIALTMRECGKKYEEIGEALGMSRQQAHRTVVIALRKLHNQ